MNFKFDIASLRQMIESRSKRKPRRNVVHTIGYNKFSPQEIFRKTKSFIMDDRNKKFAKNFLGGFKKFAQKFESYKTRKVKVKRWGK
ncbi:Hypothetical protein SFBmNL_01083 [Candidatus Arthromitus sp. SFB-mouse-NL]|uniref:hypothetical protein n=1 Tax=Candidatus Arthromitus sp. SFB-mouse-NL TaxID=1508644 RepID=UPI00049A1DA5|nr:hypothetical protein [Candidatus Arthromitus sp. SFB-mouse-NL]AID44988.1 Hypothetical protein SFBmNL_01083 [Candidatus Arthromitus sp. SFB-mouse-NL]